MKNILTRLTELIETHNLFVRERKPNWLRAMGIALLYCGLSCRQTAEVLSFFDEASYEAARQWYHRAQNMLSAPQKRYRPTVAIDETKVKVEGTWYFLWAAVDTENRELLGVSLTPTRDGHDASRFIQRVLQTCTNEHTDGARRWRSMVSGGVKQTGRALGESDVREAERSGAVVFSLQTAGETVLSAVAA